MTNIVGMPADVTSEADVKRLTAEVIEAYRPIDVLINNAGIQRIHPVEEFSKESGI